MKKIWTIACLLATATVRAQMPPAQAAQALAATAQRLWPDSMLLSGDKAAKWRYDQGVVLKGVEGVWNATGDGNWFRYMQRSMDVFVQPDGSIRGYRPDEYNIDHLNNGKVLLTLWQVTGQEKYRKAVELLYTQLATHPRTAEGSFWHKKIYTNQVWLDGLYMGQPFYAAAARAFGDDKAFNDITRQFVLIEQHARDPKTGLLYHGWDAAHEQKWADPNTGRSPNVWGRALGWYGMALVDVLDYMPEHHPGRDSLIAILNRFAEAVVKVQDADGTWFDVPNLPKEKGNYREASASCMLVYTLAKGVRSGYLPMRFAKAAGKGYAGILQAFYRVDDNNNGHLEGTVAVSGLGGNPYRDGSFAYYMSEPKVTDDPKGVGAFINMANEVALLQAPKPGGGKTVLLDYYFNNEWKKGYGDRPQRFHYTWEDRANSGFSLLGDVLRGQGFRTDSLAEAPTAQNLRNASVYVIVDPDTDKETAQPHYLDDTTAATIAQWVQEGGTLVLLANDAGNCDLQHTNVLAARFGIRFNEDHFNMVQKDQFVQGLVEVPKGNTVFPTARRLYIKELATLQVQPPALPLLSKEGKAVMALARYGKGRVLALGDPWLYNEYTDGRKLPPDFDNYAAAVDLARWLASKPSK